ncbi:unnamed protein product [Chondrus crispus]|uniref:Uncharacterized protein n=1 Tax=Chondrus crispus TaxID=2769 RepID=R7QC77_CHOCR|nr:unnamed protein product [Chondrus crispus]CDF36107.1 unnamed protein product [Chondrus crispus]|eukprot:XP_005715926.1 unnamed protein product [Chondrus crispus]
MENVSENKSLPVSILTWQEYRQFSFETLGESRTLNSAMRREHLPKQSSSYACWETSLHVCSQCGAVPHMCQASMENTAHES